MSLQRYVRQLKPIQENKTDYVNVVQDLLEEVALPKEVFDGLQHEINSKKSSSKSVTQLIYRIF